MFRRIGIKEIIGILKNISLRIDITLGLLLFVGTIGAGIYASIDVFSEVQFNRLLQLIEKSAPVLEKLPWPLVALFGLLYFKRVFAYLLFSLDGFNFFGIKGGLRPVTEVIEEKVRLDREAEKSRETMNQYISDLTQSLKSENVRTGALADRAVNLAERLAQDNIRMLKELNQKRLREFAMFERPNKGGIKVRGASPTISIKNEPNNPN